MNLSRRDLAAAGVLVLGAAVFAGRGWPIPRMRQR
jgi:hypothetical protein